MVADRLDDARLLRWQAATGTQDDRQRAQLFAAVANRHHHHRLLRCLLGQRPQGTLEALATVGLATKLGDFVSSQVTDDGSCREVAVLADADHGVADIEGILDFMQDGLQLVQRQVAGRQLLADPVKQFQRLVGAGQFPGFFVHLFLKVSVHAGDLGHHGVEGGAELAQFVFRHMLHPDTERAAGDGVGCGQQVGQRLHQPVAQHPDGEQADDDDRGQQGELNRPQQFGLALQFFLNKAHNVVDLVYEVRNVLGCLYQRRRVALGGGGFQRQDARLPTLEYAAQCEDGRGVGCRLVGGETFQPLQAAFELANGFHRLLALVRLLQFAECPEAEHA